MEQHFFYYFDEYRGHHRKGVAIYTTTEVNVHKKYGSIEQKCIFWRLKKSSSKKILIKMT